MLNIRGLGCDFRYKGAVRMRDIRGLLVDFRVLEAVRMCDIRVFTLHTEGLRVKTARMRNIRALRGHFRV